MLHMNCYEEIAISRTYLTIKSISFFSFWIDHSSLCYCMDPDWYEKCILLIRAKNLIDISHCEIIFRIINDIITFANIQVNTLF